MSKRILVGYATGQGATVGVAEAVGKALGERGFSVDVKPMKERPSLQGYDGVVLGSAVNGGKWLPEAVSYVQSNASALKDLPVSVFCVHAMNTGDGEKKLAKRRAYINDVRALIQPADEGYFAGVIPGNINGIALFFFKAFGGDIEGDARDWDKISSWAREAKV